MLQLLPFQCIVIVKSPDLWFPTAHTSLLDTAETELRLCCKMPVGATLQVFPSQCIASVRWWSPLVITVKPTAQMSLADIASREVNAVENAPGFGLGTWLQDLPSQRIANGS
jgi:hypothetical protein